MAAGARRLPLAAGLLAAALTAASPAVAQDATAPRPQARVGLGLGRSDNLSHDAAEVSSDIKRLELGFSARTERTRLRGGVTGDLQYLKYGADELPVDDEVLGSVDGLLELHFVPDRFYWDFDYSYGQVRIDPTAAVGPANRQRTTVASTGPEIALPLGERNELELGVRVADRSYGTTDALDSRLTTARLALVREIDPVTRVSVDLEESENDFDTEPQAYTFRIASLVYRKELASGEASASIGRGRVEIGGESQPTTVARLAWNRAVGARSRMEICAGRELTDAGSVFAGGGGAVGCQGELSGLADVARTTDGRLQGVVLSMSPVRRESVGLRFDVEGPRADFGLSVGTSRDRFENDPGFDNDTSTLRLSASRQFGRQWRGTVSARQWNQKFVESGDDNRDQSVRLALSRNLARQSQVSVSLERIRRVSARDPFDENVAYLSFARNFGR